MKFRVYETETNKDVTNACEWFINNDGKLLCMPEYTPVFAAESKYYYKLEITVS